MSCSQWCMFIIWKIFWILGPLLLIAFVLICGYWYNKMRLQKYMESNLSFFKAEMFQAELQQLLIILWSVSGRQSSTYYNTTLCADSNFEPKIWITQGSKYVCITQLICMTYWNDCVQATVFYIFLSIIP